MAKYRRKSDGLIVEVEQYDGPWSVPTNEPLPDVPAVVEFFKIDATDERYPFVVGKGKNRLRPGDWIITAAPDDRWCLDAYTFSGVYEPVEKT